VIFQGITGNLPSTPKPKPERRVAFREKVLGRAEKYVRTPPGKITFIGVFA
jgi:hypothetical protein